MPDSQAFDALLASRLRANELVTPGPWPPAIGETLLALAVAALLGWLVWRWRVRLRARAPWLAARAEVARLRAQARSADSLVPTFDALSATLRRYALLGWPRADVASLAGTAWTDFLGRTGAPTLAGPAGEGLGELRHQPPGAALETRLRANVDATFDAALAWLDANRPRRVSPRASS